jgi:hypothetical protein
MCQQLLVTNFRRQRPLQVHIFRLKRALTPKIRGQECLTHPLAYCTWITEFTDQDVDESEF